MVTVLLEYATPPPHDGGRNPEVVKTAVVIHGVDRAASNIGCHIFNVGRHNGVGKCGAGVQVAQTAADDALAERDCAFTRHGDGGVAFNCGLAAVGEVVAANENVIVPEGDGLVLGCIDRNGGGLSRGGSSLSRDAAAGHDMAVVRAAIDLQGGVAGRELELHVGRIHVSIVFG